MRRRFIRTFLGLVAISLFLPGELGWAAWPACDQPGDHTDPRCYDCSTYPTSPMCQCMEGVLPKYSGANCTANDVRVVLIGRGDILDGCLNPNDTVSIRLRAQINSGAQQRYDIAWFIPQDGGLGRTGLCQAGFLTPVGPSYIPPRDPGGPQYDNFDSDSCGDINTSQTVLYDYPFPVRLPCSSVTAGYLAIQRCVVWNHTDNSPTCSTLFQTGAYTALNATSAVVRVKPLPTSLDRTSVFLARFPQARTPCLILASPSPGRSVYPTWWLAAPPPAVPSSSSAGRQGFSKLS